MCTVAELLGAAQLSPERTAAGRPANPTVCPTTLFGHCVPHRCFLLSYFGLCFSPQLVKETAILGGLCDTSQLSVGNYLLKAKMTTKISPRTKFWVLGSKAHFRAVPNGTFCRLSRLRLVTVYPKCFSPPYSFAAASFAQEDGALISCSFFP